MAIASTNSLFENYGKVIDENNLNDVKGVILEWTLTITVLFGFLVMSWDVKNFRFVYEKYDSVEDKRQDSVQEIN